MQRKERIDALIDKNAIVDDGDGVIRFTGGLTLSDESDHKSGVRYDIASMDVSNWTGKVFADHDYSIRNILGNWLGVAKQGQRLVAEGIKFAIRESADALFAYKMMRGGYIDSVSIGTIGELDQDGVYRNSRLIEASLVGIGNNDNAVVNIAKQTIEQSEKQGLDTTELKHYLAKHDIEVEPQPDPEPKPKPAPAPDPEPQEPADRKELNNKETPIMSEPKKVEDQPETPKESAAAPQIDLDSVKNAITEAVKPLSDKVDAIEKQAFDKGAQAPEFKETKNGVKSADSEFASMDHRERGMLQVQAFYNYKYKGDSDALETLTKINNLHKQQLKEANIVKNVLTPADFGNFVTSPELLTEIQGYRTDYSEILAAFPYRQTNSLQMSWLTRSGDIDMQPLDGIFPTDGSPNLNLKPVSEYAGTVATKDLEELAAVTPIATAATIFAAADLLEDAGQGYRTSYDRNKARGIIAALEKAAEDNDTASFGYTASGVDTASEQLNQIRKAVFAISQGEGTLIMNEASWGLVWSLFVDLGSGGGLTDTIVNGLPNRKVWNKNVVIVPNDLMPTLGAAGTVTIDYEGANVVINHAVFYVNPMNVARRENGGLRYDLSTEAAYEVSGTVRSAYQRNEIVLRGSHFRGTAVLDPTRVGAVRALDVIS